VSALTAALRNGRWLHAGRAKAYARLVAGGLFLGLLYGFVGLVIGHNPGGKPIPGGLPLPTDFLAFWSAGHLAVTGHPDQAYVLPVLSALEAATATMQPDRLLAFFYPPTFLLICLPFAALPYIAGFFAFVAAQTAALLLALRRILPPNWGWLPILGFPGLFTNAVTGQNGFLTAALLAVPLFTLQTRPILAGLSLGALAYKPHLGLCVPVALLAARRWRAVFAAAGMAAALAALSWLVFGTACWEAFLREAPLARVALEEHREDWAKLQSLYTAVRLFGAPLWAGYAAQTLLTAGVLAVLAVIAWRRPGAGAEGAMIASASLLCAPHLLDYDLAAVAPPLAWIASRAEAKGWLPWEKTAAGLAFIWPILARPMTQNLFLPLGPLILLGLFAIVGRRARHDPG
jgi:hypothetical protein